MIRINDLKLPLNATEGKLLKKASRALGVPVEEIHEVHMFRRSLDARKKDNIHYVCAVDVRASNEKKIIGRAKGNNIMVTPSFSYEFPLGEAKARKRPVVVGFGPSGMFAALLLAEMGLDPIVIERGGDVDSRKATVDLFWAEGILNTESNVQFGEGGAGTFSDGKLTTRSKDTRCRKVLEEMVEAGAPEEVLFDAKPHIGTDLLCDVVKKMREKIIRLGGEVRFFSKLTDLEVENGAVKAVVLADGGRIETDDVILALGHSARDTMEFLHGKGFALEQKAFAVGVRIEHPQKMIDVAQYGVAAEKLPAADYRLTYTTTEGRGVYTFCMCPGGYVVGAASEEGRLTVNGMSHHARDGANANSALLVQVYPKDFGSDHPLAGIQFQRELEEKAFYMGGGNYTAPVQSVGDFLGTQVAGESMRPTYAPWTLVGNVGELFPSYITDALKEALPEMGKRLKGFDRPDAVLTGVESRSSSPVRIVRNGDYESVSMSGVYPVGEGAGYAGGIVSAAVDGIMAAEKIFAKYRV